MNIGNGKKEATSHWLRKSRKTWRWIFDFYFFFDFG